MEIAEANEVESEDDLETEPTEKGETNLNRTNGEGKQPSPVLSQPEQASPFMAAEVKTKTPKKKEADMTKGFKQVMLSDKDIKMIQKIADAIEDSDGDRPKKAAVIRKALHYYYKHKIKK